MEDRIGQASPRIVSHPPLSCASLLSSDRAVCSIGVQQKWPPCVQEIVSFLVGSPVPMHVAWGPHFHTIYNDAYASILQERHPGAFGMPMLTIWKDLAEYLPPLMQRVMSGESVHFDTRAFKPQHLRYWAYWFNSRHAPLRDGSGAPIGILSTMCESTPLAKVAIRASMRRYLHDALRNISSFDEAIRVASHVLACQLDASRVVLLQWDSMQNLVESRSTYEAPGQATLTETYDASQFGTRFFTELNAGNTWIMDEDPITAAATNELPAENVFSLLAINAALAVPLNQLGHRKNALLLMADLPRGWDGDEKFAREIVDQTLLAVDEMQLRQAAECDREWLALKTAAMSEEREHFFDIAGELLAVLDHHGRILRTNRAWERIFGYSLTDLAGKDLRDFVPVSEHARFTECLLTAGKAEGGIAEHFQVIANTGRLHSVDWKIRCGPSIVFFCGRHNAIESPHKTKSTSQIKFPMYLQRTGMAEFGTNLLQDVSVIIAVVNLTTNRFTYANNACAAHFGDPALVGKSIAQIFMPAQVDRLEAALAKIRQTGQAVKQREAYLPPCPDIENAGTEKFIDFVLQPLRDDDGSISAFIIVGHDATLEVVAINEARLASERWRLAAESKRSSVWERDLQTGSMTFSPQWLRMLGYRAQDLEPTFEKFQALVHPQDRSRINRAIKACITGTATRISLKYRIMSRIGTYQWVDSRNMAVSRDVQGNPTRLSGTLTDISKKKQTAETQWVQANFDTLTGLANRRLFMNRLDSAVAKASRSGQALALMFIDLDRFKTANDSFGHNVGDLILREAAARIKSCVRTCDTVARLGGDEFTVILSDLRQHNHIETAAQKIIEIVALPFTVGQDIVHLSASVGITLYSRDAKSSSELISNADRAMYVAKGRGGNQFSYFTYELQLAAQHRMQIIGDLKSALQNEEFTLVFQPVFKLATMEIVRAEVLLRWEHPRLGTLEPADFLAIAQESQQIDQIDDWVFCRTAHFAERIKKETGKILPLCVKKSLPRAQPQLQPFDWFKKIRELELCSGALAVEIGEEFMTDTQPSVRSLLAAYRAAGVDLILNNFGTGPFSVAHIFQHGFRFLKVHIGQIDSVTRSECKETILASVLKMAACFGVDVVICDIETDQQNEWVQTIGYAYGQGFHLSRPISEATLLCQLSKQ